MTHRALLPLELEAGAGGGVLAGLRLVDREGTATPFGAVQSVNDGLRLRFGDLNDA